MNKIHQKSPIHRYFFADITTCILIFYIVGQNLQEILNVQERYFGGKCHYMGANSLRTEETLSGLEDVIKATAKENPEIP